MTGVITQMEAGHAARLAQGSGGERQLALAVLHQAIADMVRPRVKPRGAKGSNTRSISADEHVEAKRFLLDQDGLWAMSRKFWCDAAGVEPEWLERAMWQEATPNRATEGPN